MGILDNLALRQRPANLSQPGTCVAFINQITDYNAGARNVSEFFGAPLEFMKDGPGCRGRPRPDATV